MGWNKLIVGSHALHSVSKAYTNFVNAIATFVEPIPPNNIITNETILTQYSIKQGLKVFEKVKSVVQKELDQFHDHSVVDPKNPQDIRY